MPALLGEPVHRWFQHVRWFGRVPVEQCRTSDAGEEKLKIVNGRQSIGVLLFDRLSLLGDAQLAVQGRRVNRFDKPVLRAASTAHRSSASMEKMNAHARFLSDANERRLRAVQRPEAAQDPAILITIAVAHHDLLHEGVAARVATLQSQAAARDGMLQEGPQNLGAPLQVVDRFKQGNHGQTTSRALGSTDQQANFTSQQVHAEDVGRAARHADDESAEAVGAVIAQVIGEDTEGSQHGVRFGARGHICAENRSRRRELAVEKVPPTLLRPLREVGLLESRGCQQLSDRQIVKSAVLADVE